MNAPAARRLWAIVPAAGRGERFASAAPGLPKQYTTLKGRSVLEWSLRALLAEPRVHAIVVVLAANDVHWPAIAAKLNSPKLLSTPGGAQRQDSVMNGLEFLLQQADPKDWILVHDAARPCLSGEDLGALIDAVTGEHPGATPAAAGAVLASPIVDTVKRELHGGAAGVPTGMETVDRTGLWRALTPQVFGFAQLRRALQEAAAAGVAVTDEAQALERLGFSPHLVRGSPFNIKVTRVEDLGMAAGILQMTESSQMRTGLGMDVHAFGAGDHVVLGGVRIAHPFGVIAHSDGDVVIHALCDALLGAMGDGDIGQHFPDSDPRYRGADSRVFLRVVAERMRAAGLHLVNADLTVLAEAPRIAAHRGAMAANLAADLAGARAAHQHQGDHHGALGIHRAQRGPGRVGLGVAVALTLMRSSAAKQDVNRAGAAVNRPGGRERHHIHMSPQPEIHGGFEHRAASSRSIAFAVNDSHAAAARVAAAGDEIGQLVARRCLIQTVQVQFVLGGIQAAAQSAHHLRAQARALKRQRRAAGDFRRRRPRRRAPQPGASARRDFPRWPWPLGAVADAVYVPPCRQPAAAGATA